MSREELNKLEEQDPFRYLVYTMVLSKEKMIKYPDASMQLAKEFIVEKVVELMFEFKDEEKSLEGIETFSKEPQRALKSASDYINGSSLVKIIKNKGQKIILTDIIENVCLAMVHFSKVIGNCKIA